MKFSWAWFLENQEIPEIPETIDREILALLYPHNVNYPGRKFLWHAKESQRIKEEQYVPGAI
jgi:hypothetical protein